MEKLENSIKAHSFLVWLNHILELRNDTSRNLSRPKNEDMETSTDDEKESMQVEQFQMILTGRSIKRIDNVNQKKEHLGRKSISKRFNFNK